MRLDSNEGEEDMLSRRSGRGYTIIELLTVVFIIATIAAIIVPNLRRALEKAQAVSCKSNLRNIATAISVYSNDNDGRYPTALNVITPSYVEMIPTCSAVSINTYSGGYEVNSDHNVYTLHCRGDNHTKYGYRTDEPYYTSSGELLPDE